MLHAVPLELLLKGLVAGRVVREVVGACMRVCVHVRAHACLQAAPRFVCPCRGVPVPVPHCPAHPTPQGVPPLTRTCSWP